MAGGAGTASPWPYAAAHASHGPPIGGGDATRLGKDARARPARQGGEGVRSRLGAQAAGNRLG
eukprot:9382351-Pyramimonas_sp.AAC.1